MEERSEGLTVDNYTALLNKVAELSMKLNEMQSSLREFEKQKVEPLREHIRTIDRNFDRADFKLLDIQESWMTLMGDREAILKNIVKYDERAQADYVEATKELKSKCDEVYSLYWDRWDRIEKILDHHAQQLEDFESRLDEIEDGDY